MLSRGGEQTELIGLSDSALRPIRGDQVSMVFQEPSTALNPVHTVGAQLVEGIRAHRDVSKKEARARAVELLELVGLPDPSAGSTTTRTSSRAVRSSASSSPWRSPATGRHHRRRADDRPGRHVQAAILELLLSLRDRLGTAIVLITHNMGVVADVADRVVVMYRGRSSSRRRCTSCSRPPQHPYTQRLLDAVPHLGAEDGPGEVDPSADVVLEVENLVVEFPGGFGEPSFRAVDDVSLTIRRGEVLAWSASPLGQVDRRTHDGGPAAADVRPGAGQWHYGLGLSDRQLRPMRERFGFVFQDPPPRSTRGCRSARRWPSPLHVHRDLPAAEVQQACPHAARGPSSCRRRSPSATRTSCPVASDSA